MAEPLEKKQFYTKNEYLEMEAAANCKSEYYSGEIFAMSGGSPRHSIICLNLNWSIREATRNKNCTGFESSMKVEIAPADAYVYPDLSVVCGEIELAENTTDAITNPVLIIEILSPGTESFDRGMKFEYYRMLASLKEYVMVSQDQPKVETYFRQDENIWQYRVISGSDQTVLLQSLEYEIVVKDIYHKLLFD
ncbi:MAG: Uma2 family endonuclease [Desulfococcaceae bacterium]|nr:Uma2 family endonuclease [Desulfococcaceae bacterium]